MAGPGAQLTQAHQIQQINNGAAGAALIVELGKLLKAGKLDEQGFVTAAVGADLLTQQAAVRLARQYMTGFRALVDPSTDHADLVNPEFDAGASAGRAVNALRELEEARRADPDQRNWDAEFDRIVGQLAVRSDRAAKNAGRETVVASAEANGKRWRRVTDGNPCSFCAMLAGRGPVYRSEDAAGVVVGRNNYGTAAYKAGDVRYGGKVSRGARKGQDRTRGSRGLGEQYHDYCGCSVEEALVEWEPTPREQEFADLYNRAVEACQADGIPASTSNVLGKMRELGDGIVNDAHKPETATGGEGGGSKPPRRAAVGEFDDDEERIAEFLRERGATVEPNTLPSEGGRFADSLVDGVRTEFKTLGSSTGTPTSATIRNAVTESKRRGGQASSVVFDARGTGLTEDEARRGIRRSLGLGSIVTKIRVIGDGYDIEEGRHD